MTKPTKPSTGGSKKPPVQAAASADAKPKGGNSASVKGPANAKKVQSRKIVNKRQTPWGLIITTALVVVIAVAVVGYAVSRGHKKSTASVDPSAIVGIQHFENLARNHVTTAVKYPQSPPVGGDHSPVWADCTGTVYPSQIANENAVHALEHGAIWIAYKPGLDAAQLNVLTTLVAKTPYTLLTPYAGLKSNLSLQAWGYQLFLDSASDPRVSEFIKDLRLNQTNTPELGATCDNATFKKAPSTLGHPTES